MSLAGNRTGKASASTEAPNHRESSVLDFEAHYAIRRMVQFGDLTYREISQRADTGCLALMPTDCTEQQGPHLPVSFDSWLVETVACAAAKEATRAYGICVLVLPTLPFGPTPEHRGFGSGYIDIPRDLTRPSWDTCWPHW